MRYHSGMRSFVEKTPAEQGFGASWRQEVVPCLEREEARRRRRIIGGSLITGCMVGVAGVVLLQQAQLVSLGFPVSSLTRMLVLALAGLVAVITWMVLLPVNGPGAFKGTGAVRRAVELHFANLLTQADNAGFAEVILQDLVTDNILPDRHYTLMAAYAGTYGDCRIWMIEAAVDRPSNRPSKSGHDGADLLVFRTSLPFRLPGETRADSRADHLSSIVAGQHGIAGYDADHDEVNEIFTIATTDTGAAAQLFTFGFAETLLRVHEHLASPLSRRRGAQPHLSLQATRGSLVIAVDMRAGGGIGAAARDAEQLARELIVQFATLPALVDGMQGEADTSPVFLTPASGKAPRRAMSV
ncbi:hypothetical protein AB3X55_04615 [Alphaproteobacteria bacterium LSUCC0719]